MENENGLSESAVKLKNGKAWSFGTPKTESSARAIGVGNTLIRALKAYRNEQLSNRIKYGEYYTKYDMVGDEVRASQNHTLDFVCTKENGQMITQNSLKYLSRTINYELGITFNFHSFRHTHATTLIENGANIKDVQERLGHTSISTTMDTYAHVTKKMVRDTVDVFERAVNSDLPTKK